MRLLEFDTFYLPDEQPHWLTLAQTARAFQVNDGGNLKYKYLPRTSHSLYPVLFSAKLLKPLFSFKSFFPLTFLSDFLPWPSLPRHPLGS